LECTLKEKDFTALTTKTKSLHHAAKEIVPALRAHKETIAITYK
jgi:hypothetical protein